jgi:hypothetical protein
MDVFNVGDDSKLCSVLRDPPLRATLVFVLVEEATEDGGIGEERPEAVSQE